MAKSTRTRRNYTILLAAAAASAGLIKSSLAATLTWNGGSASTDNWSDASNWNNNTPASGDALTFGGTTRLTPTNDAFSGGMFNSITFNAAAGAFVLGGNGITLGAPTDGGSGTQSGGGIINNDGAGVTQTVDMNLVINPGRHNFSTNTASGGLAFGTVGTPITITRQAGALMVFTTSGGAIDFTNASGIANDSSGILGAWATTGNDWAMLQGGTISTYTGYTDLAAGGQAIANTATSNVRLTGVTTGNSTAATGTVINTILDSHTDTNTRTVTVTGTMKLGGGGSNSGGVYRTAAAAGAFTLTGGTVTASGGGELTFSDAPFASTSNNLTIASIIANDTGAVSVNTMGYVSISAANTFTGGVTIAQGRYQAGNVTALGTAASIVTVLPGGQAFLNASGTFANPMVISGVGPTETNGGQNLGAIRMNNNNQIASGQITLAGNARVSAQNTNTLSGKITGTGRLEVTGATQTVANTAVLQISNSTNDWSGGLQITNAGSSDRNITVKLTGTGVLPDSGNVTVNGTTGQAILDINAKNEAINGLTAANSINNIVTNSSTAGTLTVGAADASSTFGGRLTGANLSVTKTGAGTFTLISPSTSNTHAGTTTVNQGTLLLNPSTGLNNLSASNIVVSGTGILNVASIGGAGFTLGTQTLTNNNSVVGTVIAPANSTVKGTGTFSNLLTLSGSSATVGGALAPGNSVGTINLGAGLTVSGGGQLSIEMDGATADQAVVTGTASVGGMGINLSVLNFNPPTLSSYVVLTATTLTGTPVLNAGSTSIGRNTFSIDVPALATNVIQIDVAGNPATIRWSNALSGTGNGVTWDTTAPGGTSQNWINPATGGSPVADSFYNSDNVVFNDTNNNKYAVSVPGAVNPGTMSVTNDAGNYAFTGNGAIGGTGSIVKGGTGSLSLSLSANAYSGGTVLNAGTLNIGSSNTSTAPSLGTGALSIGNNTTIDSIVGVSSTLANGIAQTWNGNFTFVGTNSLNMGTGAVTLTAPATITVTKNTLTVGGIIADAAGSNTVTKAGTGTLTLSGASTFQGPVNINAGIVTVGNSGALGGAPGGNVTVASGATLNLGGVAANNGLNFGQKVFHISGTGFNGLGVITNRDLITQPSGTLGATGQQNTFQQIVLDGNSTIGGPGLGPDGAAQARIDIRAGAAHGATLNLNGFDLTHQGNSKFTMVNTDVIGAGNLICLGVNDGASNDGGSFAFEAGTQILDDGGTSKIILHDHSLLGFFNNGAVGATSITRRMEMGDGLAGSFTYIASGGNGGASSVGSALALKGNLIVRSTYDNFINATMTLSGVISQDATPRKLQKINYNLLELASTTQNTFTGGLEIAPGAGTANALGTTQTNIPATVRVDSQTALDPSNVVSFGAVGTTTGIMQLNGTLLTIGGLTNTTAGLAFVENFTGAATLTVNNSTPYTFGGVMRDGGGTLGFTKDGTSSLTLTGANTYSDTTTVTNGTLNIGNGGAAGSIASATVVVNSANTLAFNRSDSITFAGNISGTGTVAQNGSGTLTLTGTSTHSNTNINSGTLVVPTPGSISGAVNFASSTVLAGNGSVGTANLSNGSIHPGLTALDGILGTMTIGSLNVTGGDLRMDITLSDTSPGANDGSHDLITVTNANFSAASTISPFFTAGVPSAGNYTLITSTNAMLHSVDPTVSGGGGSRLTFIPQFLSGDTVLSLNVTGSGADKTWVGNINGNWNVLTTSNWSPGGGDNAFANLDSATFDDSTASHNVTLTQTVTPARMIINTGGTYDINTNGFAITGVATSLYLQSGTLVLRNSGAGTNTFAGPINLDNATTLDLEAGGTIGTGPIGATNANLKINRSGTMTIGQAITGNVNLTVDSGGDVTLSGANAIPNGNLTVANGTLRAGNATALPASTSVTLGSGSNSGLIDLVGNALGGVQNLNTSGTGTTNAITNSSATTNSTITFVGSGSPSVFNGAITGTRTNLTMTNGTLALNGNSNAAALQMGDNGGTLTTPVNLAVSGNQTWASFNDTTQTATNTLTIGSGGTLTVTGAFSVVHVANNDTTAMNLLSYNGAPAPGTGGALVVNGAVTIGNNPGGGTKITTTADLSNYSSFTNNATSTTMQIANGTNIKTILTLAGGTNPASSNLINVTTINIGTSGSGNANGGSQMNLGGGTNVIETGAFNIGAGKSSATVAFVTGAPSSATVTIAGTNGGANRANITLDSETSGTANGTSHLTLTGHNSTVLGGTVLIANSGGNTGGTAAADINFDTGTFDVNTLVLGGATAGSAATTGTYNLGSDNTSTGHLIVNTALSMTNATGGTGTVNAVFNALGGLATVNCDILIPSTRTTGLSNTFTLNGATLDLTGHNIGTLAAPINFVPISGVLKNVNQLNGGTPFTKGGTAGATLVLDGVNTFTGATNVTNGTLQYNTKLTTSSALNVSDGARAYIKPSLATPNMVIVRTGSVNTNLAGKVDVGDNKMIVTGAGATGTWNGTNYTGVTGQIASGRGTSNLWDGTSGIVTSQTQAVGSNYHSIGVAIASDVRPATATATGLWGGQTITGTDTLVMYTYGGDATLDGKINIDDYVKIDSGIAANLTGWANGDFNYDGKINIDDYTTVIDANIGNQAGTFPTAGGLLGGGGEAGGMSGVSAVPEPAGLSLVGISAAIGLLSRRRRRM